VLNFAFPLPCSVGKMAGKINRNVANACNDTSALTAGSGAIICEAG